jgi:hypothetical protein
MDYSIVRMEQHSRHRIGNRTEDGPLQYIDIEYGTTYTKEEYMPEKWRVTLLTRDLKTEQRSDEVTVDKIELNIPFEKKHFTIEYREGIQVDDQRK